MLTELTALLDLLRSKGVTLYEGPLGNSTVTGRSPIVCLNFGPIDAPKTEKDEAVADPDACRCGHALYVHTNGLCGEGCDVTLCAPPEKT